MISYSRPTLQPADIAAAVACLEAGQIDPGEEAHMFRDELARHLNVPPHWVVLTASCTSALHLAAARMDRHAQWLGPIYAPALTWPGTYAWAPPNRLRLYDGWGEQLWRAAGKNEPGIMIYVELWGNPFHPTMLEVRPPALIIDAAHNLLNKAHGQWLREGEVDAVCYSFGPIKQITTMRGGALVAPWAHEIETQTDCGTRGEIRLKQWGLNADITEVGAAMGRVQLRRFGEDQYRRYQILSKYGEHLAARAVCTYATRASGHLMVVRCQETAAREGLRWELAAAGVRTRVHYPLPEWLNRQDYPKARDIETRVLTLPCHLALTDDDVERIVQVVRRWV